ncbi:aldo/keto reductase [Streptomyces sp. DT18]
MTRIDTSSNYLHHRSHEVLKAVIGPLLPGLSVSTKVGYFPGEHSLDPARLRAGTERAVRALGREPDTVLLHNPEHSRPDGDSLRRACEALGEAARAGLCRGWGVSSWDPRPLAHLDIPRPDVLMIRSGLLVGADVLEAADGLVTRWRPSQVWGMSPFGGGMNDTVWARFDPRVFLRRGASATKAQAAFRSAFALPPTDAVAVGTDDTRHLRELLDAFAYETDERAVGEYRRLLRQRRPPA